MHPHYAIRYGQKHFGPQLGMVPPIPTRIYHFTHIENLQGILEARSLVCNNDCGTREVSIANEEIQDQRSLKQVPCGRGGTLHDYVPFYFCSRSPMLLRIHSGLERYKGGQGQLVYLVSSVQRVTEAELDFVFTDRHGIRRYAQFFTETHDLRKIDWRLMRATWWDAIPEYRDRKERKQAEFLVHKAIPWDLIGFIAVMTPSMQRRVETLLEEYPPPIRKPVRVERDWYY